MERHDESVGFPADHFMRHMSMAREMRIARRLDAHSTTHFAMVIPPLPPIPDFVLSFQNAIMACNLYGGDC